MRPTDHDSEKRSFPQRRSASRGGRLSSVEPGLAQLDELRLALLVDVQQHLPVLCQPREVVDHAVELARRRRPLALLERQQVAEAAVVRVERRLPGSAEYRQHEQPQVVVEVVGGQAEHPPGRRRGARGHRIEVEDGRHHSEAEAGPREAAHATAGHRRAVRHVLHRDAMAGRGRHDTSVRTVEVVRRHE